LFPAKPPCRFRILASKAAGKISERLNPNKAAFFDIPRNALAAGSGWFFAKYGMMIPRYPMDVFLLGF